MLHGESELDGKKITPEQGEVVTYIKLGLIGEQTLGKVENEVCKSLPLFQGYFLVEKIEEVRNNLHKLVDEACDAFEQTRSNNG